MTVIGTISTSLSLNGEDVDIEWRINSFISLLEEDGVYCSPDFSFGDETWYMMIWLNGRSKRNSYGHVDLHLWKHLYGSSILQEFSLAIKTLKEEKYHEEHCTRVFGGLDRWHELIRFIPRSELLGRHFELVPNGVLTVVCTMKNMISADSASSTASAKYCPISSDSESDLDSDECFPTPSNSECDPDSDECSPTESDSESDPKSTECFHCKGAFDAVSLSSHQRKCMHRPTMCPDCLEVVVLQKWLDEHECQKKRSEAGKEHKGSSKNAGVDASAQTEEENTGKKHKESSKNRSVDTSTQTEVEDASFINLPEDYGFVTDINHLLKENIGVDVTFELETLSGKTKFFAHQLIMSVMSSYFADVFYDQGRNKGHQVIPLKGIDPKAFEQMIRYCYGEKLSLKTTEDACVLFKTASKFKVISLQNLCHAFCRHTKIDPGNVFSILKISEEMEDKSIIDMCNKILEEKTREVMATYKLCDVTPYMVYTILDLPKMSLNSEYELIKWLFDWAKVKAEDSSYENAREYLEKLLQDMNFLALTFEEFAMLCKDNPEFFTSDEIASVSLNIAFPGTREMPDWYDKDLKCHVYTGSNE